MNRYLKLVNFEFNRFLKFYLILIGITILSQMIGVIIESQIYVDRANELIYEQFIPKDKIIEQIGKISLIDITNTFWFLGPIALCIVTLVIYVFFIWYRDWLGKNTFIYRLLMLPTSRIHIYLAKATTILLFVLGLVALQLLLLPIEGPVVKWIVPSEFRTDLPVHELIINSEYYRILLPHSFIDFILFYGVGMAAVFIVFTAILFERSYRKIGIIYGILFCLFSLVIMAVPILLDSFVLIRYFYPIELLFMELIAGCIVLAIAIWTSNFLIKNKVRV
jgi:hypothetical protein